jgi:hypothetical protein
VIPLEAAVAACAASAVLGPVTESAEKSRALVSEGPFETFAVVLGASAGVVALAELATVEVAVVLPVVVPAPALPFALVDGIWLTVDAAPARAVAPEAASPEWESGVLGLGIC